MTLISGAVFLLQVTLPSVGFGGSAYGGRTFSLPWLMIAEKVREGVRFCENKDSPDGDVLTDASDANATLDPNCHYAFQPAQAGTIRLPAGKPASSPLGEVEISLAKWVESSWQDVGKLTADMEPNEIRINGGFEGEGFFRLRFAPGTQEKKVWTFESYAIVLDDWKKDILSFCRELKEEIESAPDAQLIRSSVAISHFDRTMYIAADTHFLSGRVLKALENAVSGKEVFEAGGCPDFAAGSWTRIRLKRFEGGQDAEFAVFVPQNYNNSRKWPVLVRIAGRGSPSHSERPPQITVNWGFSNYTAEFEWRDLEYLFGSIGSRLNLDQDRISIHGHCGYGITGVAVALHHPDYFAECSSYAGNSFRHLTGNALNLRLFYTLHGTSHLFPYCNFAVKCCQYYGCRHFQFSRAQPEMEERLALFAEAPKQRSPKRVLYTIDSLNNPRAYWAQIDGRTDENFPATIDAVAEDQRVCVKTKNVDAYRLDLVQAPVDSNKPVEIFENDRSLGSVTSQLFVKRPEAYAKAAYVKNRWLHRPVWDAFREPYVLVWGSGGRDKTFSESSRELAESIAGGALCSADTDLPERFVDSHNLILVGTAESNLWLAKVCEDLPVQTKAGQIIANRRRYDAPDMGYILIYPNPLNPEKYVVAFSGTSSAAMTNAAKAYSQMKSMVGTSDARQPSDVGVFEVTSKNELKWHIMEKFDTQWSWHPQWDEVLAVVNRKHPKWQWRQWVARALRNQFGVDVVICMDPFKFSDLLPVGKLTYRDLFNSFRNDWMIKVKVDGKSLKELLLVPLRNASAARTTLPIIDGVTAPKWKQNGERTVLGIDELKEKSTYTAAMPYMFVNGELLGVGLTEYEILGEGYLVLLLKEYLSGKQDLDLDAQLDSLELNIF